jgi:hypothetical protein
MYYSIRSSVVVVEFGRVVLSRASWSARVAGQVAQHPPFRRSCN